MYKRCLYEMNIKVSREIQKVISSVRHGGHCMMLPSIRSVGWSFIHPQLSIQSHLNG